MRVEGNVLIRQPTRSVFAYLADVRNIPRWTFGVLEAIPLGNEPPGLGHRYRMVSQLLGRKLEQVFEITSFEPHELIAFTSFGDELETAGSYRLFDRNGTTLLIHQSQSLPESYYKLGRASLRKVVERHLETNLRNLRDLLEDTTEPTPDD